ncbi:hypothetical protein [Nocardioides zeae]
MPVPVTRYLLTTTLDLVGEARALRAATFTITYGGQTLKPEAGVETHKILGRFSHCEVVVKDYGTL